MSGQAANKKLFQKLPEVQFDIDFNINGSSAAQKSDFQERALEVYLQNGQSVTFDFNSLESGELRLIGKTFGETLQGTQIAPVYPFIIIEPCPGFLELIIGLGNHADLARYASKFYQKKIEDLGVKAAGDIYSAYNPSRAFTEHTKSTDQAGAFYVPNTDPQYHAKKASIKAAIQSVGLPLDKFQHYAPQELLFSQSLRNRLKTNFAQSHSATLQNRPKIGA